MFTETCSKSVPTINMSQVSWFVRIGISFIQRRSRLHVHSRVSRQNLLNIGLFFFLFFACLRGSHSSCFLLCLHLFASFTAASSCALGLSLRGCGRGIFFLPGTIVACDVRDVCAPRAAPCGSRTCFTLVHECMRCSVPSLARVVRALSARARNNAAASRNEFAKKKNRCRELVVDWALRLCVARCVTLCTCLDAHRSGPVSECASSVELPVALALRSL